jgi:hypothetical protein
MLLWRLFWRVHLVVYNPHPPTLENKSGGPSSGEREGRVISSDRNWEATTDWCWAHNTYRSDWKA